jgi:hypothetical protein
MKHLESYEAACEVLGIDPNALPIVSHLSESRAKGQIALYKLETLAEADWKQSGEEIDWDNDDQPKYSNWFNMSPSGFSFCDYGYDNSSSRVGSRLSFQSRKSAEYVAEKHLDLYRDFMLK